MTDGSSDNMGDEEEEILTSAFTVAELWQRRLPRCLKEETFGYLDVRQGNRLCRVSTGWKSSLLNLAQFNQGIAFFQWPQSPQPSEKKFQWTKAKMEEAFWKDELLMKVNTLKHFVFLEMNAVRSSYGSTIIQEKLISLPQPVNLVTLYRCEIHQVMIGWFSYLPCNSQHSPGKIYQWYDLDEKLWQLALKRPLRTLTKETMAAVESRTDENERPSAEPNFRKYNGWLLGKDSADFGLIWPYPEEQLQWLRTSLEGLREIVSVEVASLIDVAYRDYSRIRRNVLCLKNGSQIPKMNLKWNWRDLDILDCACFARLLSLTPGVPKPPYPLPDDM